MPARKRQGLVYWFLDPTKKYQLGPADGRTPVRDDVNAFCKAMFEYEIPGKIGKINTKDYGTGQKPGLRRFVKASRDIMNRG